MTATRGILAYGAHVPYRRLDRAAIRNVMGSGGGRGHRAVASFDQDTTTMGVEAARQALVATDLAPGALWFSTVAPAYLDKTNATTAHAALRLDAGVPALDLGGAARSAVGALRTALEAPGRTLVVAADLRCGLPTSTDEAAGGDAASAVLTGSDDDGPLLAEYLGGASATAEFVDRWRTPGDATSRTWEERFGEQAYAPLVDRAWADALAATGLDADGIDLAVVTGLHARATKRSGGRLGVTVADDRSDTIGNSGAAHPALLLADVLDTAETGTVVALVVLADGCDVLLFRTTDALAAGRPAASVEAQVAGRADLDYPTYLSWRGLLEVQPPNRPAPNRPSSSAARRRSDWKYGFVGSRDATTGTTHLPPSRVGVGGGAVDDMEPAPMADAEGTIVTFTVDRLAYSPSPPVVFAVVDFDGGGRMPIELTDVDPAEVAVGGRVAMTFRRINTADGIHNYFWKARPVRG
ncbi:MAG: OB-fold domain-containing protein [Acidimicrobiales bacterium]|nr:OB-fold domain-containing protein [Acidimicrobiales bacterium]